MLDALKDCFKQQFQFSHMAGLINHIGNIVAIIQVEYTKDGNAKNAAIDTVCQMLQSHKDVSTSSPNSNQTQA